MVIVSGLVLDYFTNKGVADALVYAVSASGSSILISGNTSPIGSFELNVPTTTQDVVYFAESTLDRVGYSRQFKPYIQYVNLYLRQTDHIPSVSGGIFTNCYNAMLTTASKVDHILNSPTHLYVVTEGGLDIIDLNNNLNVGYIIYSGGFTDISLNRNISSGNQVLLGTTNSGVLQFTVPETYNLLSRDLTNSLYQKYNTSSGTLTSNYVNCIHQSEMGDIIIGTTSGIDYFTPSGIRYYTNYSGSVGTTACFVSNSGDIYYSPTNSGLYVKSGTIVSNWTTPDYMVVLSGTGVNPFPLLSNYINDVSVTTESDGNTVFIATLSGLLVYKEESDLNLSASGAKLFRNYP